jgi:hypothetical protein
LAGPSRPILRRRPPYGSPGWKKADQDIREIGTNGIPTLLKMIRARDWPPFVLKSMEAVRRVVADGRIILCAQDNHRDVFLAIRRL